MNTTESKIAAGLERAFAEHGFAEPSVEALRDAAGVSLRTLYKYTPSREMMVRTALDHRHWRYIGHLFDNLPEDHSAALKAIIERVAVWMQQEATHGCLFHAAVASAPHDPKLRALLQRHKSEVAQRAVAATGQTGREVDLTLIIEGLTQSWPLHREAAVESAQRLSRTLCPDC
ncbi:MAG: TetR/AcrR family transcriptional regulator [Hoeflea sp.]|uniref:TetR/AcrR family transcriptional regulator n=1 Tax=Hoeflea sp. TaxID=1940281 RepID=UPI003EF1A932